MYGVKRRNYEPNPIERKCKGYVTRAHTQVEILQMTGKPPFALRATAVCLS